MHIIAISNRKGGTGKTTVSVNLAAEMAYSGLRVLLIDLDSQGHCAVGLGLKLQKGEPCSHQLFVEPAISLSATIHSTLVDNLWLSPADPLFDHGSGQRDDQRLKRAIQDEALHERFDLILIDTPPSLDALLFNGLQAATRVLIPYVPHPLSFEGVRQLVRVLFKVMTRENRELKILGFLPNMVAEHVRQHRQVNSEVGRQFGAQRVLPGIRNDIRLAEAFAAGKPIRAYAPGCRGALDFLELAKEIREGLNGTATRPVI